MPPSAGIVAPWIMRDSSEARNSTMRGGRRHSPLRRLQARPDPALRIRDGLEDTAPYDGRLRQQPLDEFSTLIELAGHKHENDVGRWRIDERHERLGVTRRGLTLAGRLEQALSSCRHHHTPGCHHRKRPRGIQDLSERCVPAVKPIYVECAEIFIDDTVEFGRDLSLLMLVVAKDEIHRIDMTRRYLRVERCRGDHRDWRPDSRRLRGSS